MSGPLHINFGNKSWANIADEEDEAKAAKESPRARAARLQKAQRDAERERYERIRRLAEAAQRAMNEEERFGPNTGDVRRMRSSFKRYYQRNPTSFIRSRRRKLGRPSRTPRSSSPRETRRNERASRPAKRSTHHARRHSPPRAHASAAAHPGAHAKPRPGKFMKECKDDCKAEGCARHKTTGDCKFVHRDEPEHGMLRENQKTKKGGFSVASPAPLSSVNTYTSWPGGVDPTARLYNQSAML